MTWEERREEERRGEERREFSKSNKRWRLGLRQHTGTLVWRLWEWDYVRLPGYTICIFIYLYNYISPLTCNLDYCVKIKFDLDHQKSRLCKGTMWDMMFESIRAICCRGQEWWSFWFMQIISHSCGKMTSKQLNHRSSMFNTVSFFSDTSKNDLTK